MLTSLASAALAALGAAATQAASSPLAAQSLRPYWHVFIAYAVVWIVLFGWIVSINRRLKDVEERVSGE